MLHPCDPTKVTRITLGACLILVACVSLIPAPSEDVSYPDLRRWFHPQTARSRNVSNSAGIGSAADYSSAPPASVTNNKTAEVPPKDLAELPLKIAIITTTGDELNKLWLWMRYHRLLGVTHFYLFTEGAAARPSSVEFLQQQTGVEVFPPSTELDAQRNSSRIWHEKWLKEYFGRPCNSALHVRQNLNVELGIQAARRDGVEWVVHIDVDELLHPASDDYYSMQVLLGGQGPEVDAVVFPNHEALPEASSVRWPFLEVTLFKRNYQHVPTAAYYQHYRQVAHGNANYFLAYANGKSAARVQARVRPNGAHRFHVYQSPTRHEVVEVLLPEAAVLHYTYTQFGDLAARQKRCRCGLSEAALNDCFLLSFDRAAYTASATLNASALHQWYDDHLLWRNRTVVQELLQAGLFQRVHTPQVLIQWLLDSDGDRAPPWHLIHRGAAQRQVAGPEEQLLRLLHRRST